MGYNVKNQLVLTFFSLLHSDSLSRKNILVAMYAKITFWGFLTALYPEYRHNTDIRKMYFIVFFCNCTVLLYVVNHYAKCWPYRYPRL